MSSLPPTHTHTHIHTLLTYENKSTMFIWNLHQGYNQFRGHVRVLDMINSFLCMFGSGVATEICPTVIILDHCITMSAQYYTSVALFIRHSQFGFNMLTRVHGWNVFPKWILDQSPQECHVNCKKEISRCVELNSRLDTVYVEILQESTGNSMKVFFFCHQWASCVWKEVDIRFCGGSGTACGSVWWRAPGGHLMEAV